MLQSCIEFDGWFQGGLLEAPLYPLKPGVSRGPGPLEQPVIRPLHIRTIAYMLSRIKTAEITFVKTQCTGNGKILISKPSRSPWNHARSTMDEERGRQKMSDETADNLETGLLAKNRADTY